MSFWQSKERGEMLKSSNQIEKIINIGDLIIEKRSIGLNKNALFILGVDKDLDENILKEIERVCLIENSVFIQIETFELYKNIKINSKNYINFYYKKFITPFTSIINLDKTEDEILSQMKPKGRYNIKVAIKNGVFVQEVSKTKENIEIFYNLMKQTTSRDKFNGNTIYYYEKFLQIITGSSLLIAYKDTTPIASGIFVFNNDESIYYYGASTSDESYRNLMAPYLLQWIAIKKAKDTGSKIYDFLGIASPGDKKSQLLGVTDFKLKLSQDIKEISKSYIFINKKFTYKILILLKKIKNLIKNSNLF